DAKQVGATLQLNPSLAQLVETVINESKSTGMPASRDQQIGSDRIVAAAYPVDDDSTMTAWAVKRLPYYSGLSDWPNFIALIAMGISFVAVCGLAFITVKDL